MRESKSTVELNALLALRAKQQGGFIFDQDFSKVGHVEFLLSAGYVARVDPAPVVKWGGARRVDPTPVEPLERLQVTAKGQDRLSAFFEAVGV